MICDLRDRAGRIWVRAPGTRSRLGKLMAEFRSSKTLSPRSRTKCATSNAGRGSRTQETRIASRPSYADSTGHAGNASGAETQPGPRRLAAAKPTRVRPRPSSSRRTESIARFPETLTELLESPVAGNGAATTETTGAADAATKALLANGRKTKS